MNNRFAVRAVRKAFERKVAQDGHAVVRLIDGVTGNVRQFKAYKRFPTRGRVIRAYVTVHPAYFPSDRWSEIQFESTY